MKKTITFRHQAIIKDVALWLFAKNIAKHSQELGRYVKDNEETDEISLDIKMRRRLHLLNSLPDIFKEECVQTLEELLEETEHNHIEELTISL